MQKFQFVKIDSVLSKFKRDYRGLDINENDAIEWIGEALGFMKIVSASEEAVAFIEVKNYHATIPSGLHYINQIVKDNTWEKPEDNNSCVQQFIPVLNEEVYEDCEEESEQYISYDEPFLSLQYKFTEWITLASKKRQYTSIRLSNHTFFNKLVCPEENFKDLYNNIRDEYTIVQDKIRFSFKEGFVALAYIRQMIDSKTGYPMIPDDESARAAITYYLGWKIKEMEGWNHREGSMQLAQIAEQHWLKYVKQFKNKAKMPTGIDQHQNLLESAFSLIPNHNKYYGFFGKSNNLNR